MSKVAQAVLNAALSGNITIRMEDNNGITTKVQSYKRGEKIKTHYDVDTDENHSNQDS